MKDFIHMSKFEKTLLAGAEWVVKAPLWLVLQLKTGVVYVRSGQMNSEIPLGGLVVVPPNSSFTLLASVLGEARLRGFSISISSLTGVLTLAERWCLEKEAARECAPFRPLLADHSLTVRMGALFQVQGALDLQVRLGALQSFAEWLSPFLAKAAANDRKGREQNLTLRLTQFLHEMPESELVDISLSDLAKQLCCSARHASRLFHESCGCGFRKYVADLRLKRACHLLVHRDYKVIDVALESGHSSLALFNYNFKNRFHMTPTEWRERHLASENHPVRGRFAARRKREQSVRQMQ